MKRPSRYEECRYLGDKRTQVVFDLDEVVDEAVIHELAGTKWGQTFGPDTHAEARNRGYRLRSV